MVQDAVKHVAGILLLLKRSDSSMNQAIGRSSRHDVDPY